VRVPHKPLLLLWLFSQFAATGSSVASYQQAEEPVSQLINDFGPPVASPPQPVSEPPCPSSTWNATCC
jgi:putative restriction endonuclease